jgi:RND family efflux transporter MFP subunit
MSGDERGGRGPAPARWFGRLGTAGRILAILGAGVLGFALLMILRPRPAQVTPERRPPLVTTVPADVRSGFLTVRASGTVRARSEVQLSPQVQGRVVWTSPALVSGGRFAKGDALLRIDPADYENAVAAAEAEVASARVELLRWEEEGELARDEYARLRTREGIASPPDSSELGRLVFREPQIAAARAAQRRAEARLADARLALSRTGLTAPFDGIVRREAVDVGQFVTPGAPLATIYATDEVEIIASLTGTEAGLVEGLWSVRTGDEAGIPASVRATVVGGTWTWNGYVDRAEGALNPETRTVDVVIRVPDPFEPGEDGRPPLLLGTFAEVQIRGVEREHFVSLPRPALRDGDAVWAVVDDSILRIVPAEPLQEVEGTVLLDVDLAAGTPVIVSALSIVTDGMQVRTEPAPEVVP